jgi:hypothetical protein
MQVRSVVIDWPSKIMTITDIDGIKHEVSLDVEIEVTMQGYPERETKTLWAYQLGPFLSRGYIIEQIEVKEQG